MTSSDMDTESRDESVARRRPTVYQVAERAGVSIATVSRALRADTPVAPATRERVLAAMRDLESGEAVPAVADSETSPRRRPTVYQVAERAGVSIATVSRALRGDIAVAVETRERVMAAAKALNWWPSRAAQALAGEGHDAVAIVFPDLAGPYYASVIAGFESEVVHRGSAVMVLATHGRAASARMVRDLSSRSDGVVIMDQTIPDTTVAEVAENVAVVLLARPQLPSIASVQSANTESAIALTRHLLEHGLRRLRFVGDLDMTPDVRQRWDGFVTAHAEAGLPKPAQPVPCIGLQPDDGYLAAQPILAEGAVDAFVCANDELASGVYRAIGEAGLSIPGDIAVTGWDDVNIAVHLSPRLTTVRQPLRELGATAARMLFERIESRPATSTQLPTEVVIRQSCGCAASA